jgi:5-(aminomethyl)-3-furanmethanol phosphate kinase
VIVVKLGGSLGEGEHLPAWLASLAPGAGRTVVVPGGGGFADAVRAAQRRHGFSDRAAHAMALLAMEQYGLMLADLLPALAPCRTLDAIGAALARRRVALWLPTELVLAEAAIPASWDVTSDSLAAWLAQRLGARRLVLVKSVAAPPPLEPRRLAAAGLVDRAFPDFAAGLGAALDWVAPGEERRLAALVAE